MAKLNDRCFCYLTAAILVPFRGTLTWLLYTKLYELGLNTFSNNAQMKNRTDQNLSEIIYVYINHQSNPIFFG